MSEIVEPGIYPGLSFDEYSRIRGVNHSKLRHFELTPAHARWNMLHPEESSAYQELGHALHTALLEPERFETQYVVAPDVDRRTKEGKAIWADFLVKAEGKSFILDSEMECLRAIKANVAAHQTANEALHGAGLSELSSVWIDPGTGLLCKGRLDRLCYIGSRPFIVDVKTGHGAASTGGWQRSIERYRLHEQAAHYRNGLHVLAPLPDEMQRGFAWLVCETEPPYAVRMFEADELSLDIGADHVAKHLAQYKECEASGSWPAWEQGMSLAGLPPWALRKFDVD